MIRNKNSRAFNIVNYAFLTLLTLAMLIPFLVVLSGSLTDEKAILMNGVKLIPDKFSTYAYNFLFTRDTGLLDSYKISILVTAVGTFLSVLVSAGLAYALSIRTLKLRNAISFYIGFTMLFSGGLIPWYLLCVKYLHLKDTLVALILPMLVNPFNVILMRTSFKQIPESLRESGIIDGAGELRILFRIIMPVSLPIMATISLFYMLSYWNDWYTALFLINKQKLMPLQFHLYSILSSLNYLQQANPGQGPGAGVAGRMLPTESVRLATTIVTIGPIVFVYPFAQKYFVKGITVGAIKG